MGFGVTLWQIRNVKTAADAQRDAIASLKFRMSQFDIVAECTKADAALGDLKKSLLDPQTLTSLEVVDKLATSFITILEGSPSIDGDVKSRLRDAVDDMNNLSQSPSKRKVDDQSAAKRMASVREYHGIIVKIRAQIQEEHNP